MPPRLRTTIIRENNQITPILQNRPQPQPQPPSSSSSSSASPSLNHREVLHPPSLPPSHPNINFIKASSHGHGSTPIGSSINDLLSSSNQILPSNILHQEEEKAHHKLEHNHELAVAELHNLKLEQEHLREVDHVHELKRKEREAERRKQQAMERRVTAAHTADHTEDVLRHGFDAVNKIISHEKQVDLQFHWLVAIKRSIICAKFQKISTGRILEARRRRKVDLNCRLIQNKARFFLGQKKLHACADIVLRNWKLRNVSVKKKHNVERMWLFLREGRLVHKWWLLASQIKIQIVFIQRKVRAFQKITKARLFVLNLMWFVAERRAMGEDGSARVDRKKLLKLKQEKHVTELRELEKEKEKEKEKERLKEKVEEVREVEEVVKKDVKKNKNKNKNNKGEKEKKDFLRATPKPPPEKKRSPRPKQKQKQQQQQQQQQQKEKDIFPTSKIGGLSWIPFDSLAVYNFLDSCLCSLANDVQGGPIVPNYLFECSAKTRDEALRGLVKEARLEARYRYEDERQSAFARAKVALTEKHCCGGGGVGEFSVEDAKRMMHCEIRLSGLRVKSLRQSAIFRKIKCEGVLLYSKFCSHVKMNSFVNEGLKTKNKV